MSVSPIQHSVIGSVAVRRRRSRRVIPVTAMMAAVSLMSGACSGKAADNGGSRTTVGENSFVTTTPAAVGTVPKVDWNLFYEPTSLDPAHALNYTENEVLSNLCEPLVTLNPDFSYSPNLATYANPNPTTWIYTIRSGVKFWDGHPLTADDVAYSLNRNISSSVGSYYGDYFRYVKSIRQTGPLQVTVSLKSPDELFNQAMAIAAGAVTEKKFDEAHPKNLGSPSVGVMCTGPYTFTSWSPGQSLVIDKNENYWNKGTVTPKVGRIAFQFNATDSSQTNALTSGELQGMYEAPVSGTRSLRASGNLYLGKSLSQFVITMLLHNSGRAANPVNDVRVRQALSLAMDRAAVAKTVFNGTAVPPASRTLFAEPVYPYGQKVFEQAQQKTLPSLDQDLTRAKALVKAAGSPTTPMVLAYVSDGPSYNVQLAQYIQASAQGIGLKITLKPLTTNAFNNIGFDPKADAGIDMLIQNWFNELPDPVQFYRLFTPGADGSLNVFNYGKYQNAEVTADITKATRTADPTERARLVVAAQKQVMTDLPWIPLVDMANRLYMNKDLTGPPAAFVQMWYPWAAYLGASK